MKRYKMATKLRRSGLRGIKRMDLFLPWEFCQIHVQILLEFFMLILIQSASQKLRGTA